MIQTTTDTQIEKAIEQYVLDTGADIPLTTSAAHDHFARDVDELFTSYFILIFTLCRIPCSILL